MTSGNHLEYDKGPSLEDETEADGDRIESETPDDGSDDGRPVATVPPWVAGLCSGAGAFAVVFTVTYQLAGAVFAVGMFDSAENPPSQWAIAGLTMVGSHGGTIEFGGEPIPTAFRATASTASIPPLTSHVSVLVPIVVLLAASYLLVRSVRLETLADGGLAIGSMAVSYVVLTVLLAQVATWSPDDRPAGPDADAQVLAAVTDASLVLSVGGTVLVFATLGAALAALPRLLENDPVTDDERDDA